MDEILSYRQYVRPFYVMAKPAGARCNLRCTYCYYLEKSNLYPAAPAQTMSDELLERFIRDYIAAQAGDAVSFAWHGGETLLRSRDFYRRVIELQRRYADGRQIDNRPTARFWTMRGASSSAKTAGWWESRSTDRPRRTTSTAATGREAPRSRR